MFAALLPLILGLAPQLAGMIFGDKGAETTEKVTDIVAAATGSDPRTPEGAEIAIAAIKGDAAKADALRQQLHDLHLELMKEANRESDQARADVIEKLKAELADVGGARSTMVELAKAHSPMVWGSTVVSVVIVVAFGIVLFMVLKGHLDDTSKSPLANVLLGTLAAMATQVANFWLGSSSGSQSKSNTIASMQDSLARSVPEGVVDKMGRRQPG